MFLKCFIKKIFSLFLASLFKSPPNKKKCKSFRASGGETSEQKGKKLNSYSPLKKGGSGDRYFK
jgi:hypothetical protein